MKNEGLKLDQDKPRYELMGYCFDHLIPEGIGYELSYEMTDWFFSNGSIESLKFIALRLQDQVGLPTVSKVLEYGSKKYAAWNYMSGLKYSRLLGAFRRHLIGHFEEYEDKETSLPHLAHAACCVLFLLEYESNPMEYVAYDDRPKSKTEAK
jgi:hypothetical protein